ncbi:hypothetical protein [Nodosilinea nodulosa]|uniref:hypothetical protein n=1 Tax=Nodosilinea nodulosa TaxID=416001 RepID=UPI0012D814AA|nr:hypothetical protein [Nodosilinea nodulosa]
MKADLEIELLHDKMNLLREEEVVTILEILKEQQHWLRQVKEILQGHPLKPEGDTV